MKRFILFLALFTSAPALAATASLSWVNPTTYSDGTAFPASDYASLKVNYGICPDGKTMPTTVQTVSVPENVTPLVTAYVVTGLQNSAADGSSTTTYCFQVFVVSKTHGTSAGSNIAAKLMPVPVPPNPASGLTIDTVTAYMEVRGEDRFTLVAVGTVPANTPCDMTQGVNGYNVVPNKAVTWGGNVRPPVVVAKCTG